MIRVRAPNGVVVQFPDGTPGQTINGVMGHYHATTAAQADARQMVGHGTNDAGPFMAFMNGRTLNFAPEAMGAAGAINTAVDNLGRTLTGKPKPYGAADMYTAARDEARREAQAYSQDHPVANTALNVTGAAALPLNAMAGRYVAGARGLLPAVARSAAVGAPLGAAYGAGAAGPGDRLSGAAQGGATGAVLGAAVPIGGAALGATGGMVGGIARNVQRGVGAAKPQDVAVRRLASALAKDVKAGVDPRAALQGWSGVSPPTLADVGGENVRATIRDAASLGPARQTAQKYRDQVAADLQNHAQTITQRLTPGETRTPQQLEQDLAETRSQNAQTNYAQPYAAPIDLNDPHVIQALRDPEGSSAISRAIAGARANMDYGAVADLQALKTTAAGPTGDTQVWPTTGRALDRVQIAFGNRGQQLTQGGSRDIGAGMFKRQSLVNGLLDNTPGLQEARGDYRDLSRQIDAIGHGQTVPTANPSTLADLLKGSGDGQLNAAAVGSRDALMKAIGAPTEGAVGALNKLSTNTNTGQNMALVHGPEATQNWRDAIQAEAQRMDNANYIAPNTGPQTFNRAQDAGHGISHNPIAMLAGLVKRVVSGAPLNDAERSAMVQPSLDQLSPEMLAALMRSRSPQGMFGSGYLAAPLASVSTAPLAQ